MTMPLTPQSGPLALLQVSPSAGTPATVPGINWTLNIDAMLKKIPNFQTGRDAAATLEDADLSFTLVYDATGATSAPHGTAGIDAGNLIKAKLLTDATRSYSGTFRVATVGPNVSSLEDILMFPVTAMLIGVLTRPALT
jgi:hypothetical protein